MGIEPKLEFLTGQAGTGKTYEIKSRIAESKESTNPHTRNYGVLCATTGIAAVNLSGGTGDNVTTINSLLKFFDTESLRQAYAEGKLQRALKSILAYGGNLICDEVSMMEAEQLDILYLAIKEVNQLEVVIKRGGLGLILTGDFCQLPPVKGNFAFYANCWSKFADSITKLTKVYRQDNPEFLAALNAARRGDGDETAKIISDLDSMGDRGDSGGIFTSNIDTNFEGTTIYGLNKDVDRLNNTRLLDLLREGASKIVYKPFRWGQQKGEWKLIPDELVACENAYVMILANNPPDFDFANGDCGRLISANEKDGVAWIELKRNGKQVKVKNVSRVVSQREKPEGVKDVPEAMGKGEYKEYLKRIGQAGVDLPEDGVDDLGIMNQVDPYRQYLRQLTMQNKGANRCSPYFDYVEGRWIVGQITYMPLRLAYASTVHKTQGLTLDAIQIDPYSKFTGSPSMMYVALSRVRSHEGLKIVGTPELLAERTNVLGEVLPWI